MAQGFQDENVGEIAVLPEVEVEPGEYRIDFDDNETGIDNSNLTPLSTDNVIRSFHLYSEHSIGLGYNDQNYYNFEEPPIIINQERISVRELWIKIDTISNVSLIASTDPTGAPSTEGRGGFSEGNPYFKSDILTGGDTITLNIRDDLGKNGNNGVIRNQDSTDNLLGYIRSDPNREFEGPFDIKAQQTTNLEGEDIYELKLEAPASDVEYEVFLH